jgi:hypothetical protein
LGTNKKELHTPTSISKKPKWNNGGLERKN